MDARLKGKLSSLLLLGFAFARCAASQDLVAPEDSTKDSRAKDMGRCLAVAEGKVSSEGYSVLGVFDDLKQYILKDRDTAGFVYTTQLSRRSAPVANADGYPVRRESLFARSDEITDRYVMCLLAGGYKWKESTKTYYEEVRDLADRGVLPAKTELAALQICARCAPAGPNYNAFAKLLREAAEAGYPIAQFNLAQAYVRGDGVAPNEEEALRWFLAAARNGYARARPILEREAQIRTDIERKRKDVVELAADQQKAEQGDAKAQFTMGNRYEDGRGVTPDMTKAMEWYTRAAENGLAMAQRYLGVIYDKARGVAQDHQKAAEWYRKAADQGDGQAQFNLGVFYLYGFGVERSKDEARKWFERANTSGYAGAAAALRDL